MKSNEDNKILRVYKAEDKEEIIKFLHNFPNKSYKDNPYFRHLETLIEFGKPTGKYQIIQLKYQNTIYLLGTVVFSPGKRTLFFPGFHKLEIPYPKTKIMHEIHHITYEKSMKEGHIKFRDQKIRFPDFLTKKISKYYFWFGLAINHPEVLFKVPEHKELIKFPKGLKGDIDRRLNLINDFYKKSRGFGFGNKEIKSNEFLNFEFFLTLTRDFDHSEFLKIPLGSSGAAFKSDEGYHSMSNIYEDNNSGISSIIRLTILPKNKNNLLSRIKSALFFYYVKPFRM